MGMIAFAHNEKILKFNGTTWDTIPSGFLELDSGQNAGYGNGKWMVVGIDGSVGYSTDGGDNWTIVRQSGVAPFAGNVNFSTPLWVTGNTWIITMWTFNAPTILSVHRSTDGGDTWANATTIPAGTNYQSVPGAFKHPSSGLIVACGANGAIMTSTDGDVWTARDPLSASNPGDGMGIVWDDVNGLWICTARRGGASDNQWETYTATDPTAASPWTLRDTVATSTFGWPTPIGTGGGITMIGVTTNVYRYSTDGINWANPATPPLGTLTGVAYEGGTLYASVRNAPADQLFYTSTDGSNWTLQFQDATTEDPYGLASDGQVTIGLVKQVWSNNAETTIVAPGINSSQTTIPVADGSVFTTPTGGEFELLTIDNGTNIEIVKMTSRSGNTLTVKRAQEGTTGRGWAATSPIKGRITKGTLEGLKNRINLIISNYD